jgi:hypothetical protein
VFFVEEESNNDDELPIVVERFDDEKCERRGNGFLARRPLSLRQIQKNQ